MASVLPLRAQTTKPLNLRKVELVAAAFEQQLAQPGTLVERGQVQFVNLALVIAACPGRARRRVAGHLALDLEDQDRFTGPQGTDPPVGSATAADHRFEMQMGDDAAISLRPGFAEDSAQGSGIGGLAISNANLGTRAQHDSSIAERGALSCRVC